MARKVQLETIGNRVVDTLVLDATSFGATYDLKRAKIGKAVSLAPISANTGQEGTAVLCADGAEIHGRLENVQPKGNIGGVVKSGYIRVPYTGSAPVPGALDGTGYVIGGGAGLVKACSVPVTVAELLAKPKKVVSVRTSDTTCVIKMEADVL